MKIIICKDITVTEPTEEFLDYCTKALTMDNPQYYTLKRMGKWTGNIPTRLYMYYRNGDEIHVPYGVLDWFRAAHRSGIYFETEFAQGPRDYIESVPVSLRDYQQKAVDAMMSCWTGGVLQAPTGSGKTRMGLAIIGRLRQKALWLTHTRDLLSQSYSAALEFYDKDDLGTITDGKVNIGRYITFATVQTMVNLDLTQIENEWGVIIVDECHHVCGTPLRLQQFSKVLNGLNAHTKIGLSATLHRADGLERQIFAYLGGVRYTASDADVKSNILKPTVIVKHRDHDIPDDVLEADGTINPIRYINNICDDMTRGEYIADLVCRILNSEPSRRILILTDRVQHCMDLQDYLDDVGVVNHQRLCGNTKKADRDDILQMARRGDIDVLIATYQLAKEGLDIPRLDTLIMATPQQDETVVIQSIGRVCRTHDEKLMPQIYDIVDDDVYAAKKYTKRRRIYRKMGAIVEEM